jgi:hypothetical protein
MSTQRNGARRHLVRGIIAGAVVLILGVGAGAFAYWQSAVTATSTAGAAQLVVSTTNFSSVADTFGNESLTTTGSVSVTNSTTTTSTRVPALALAFSRSSGSSALAGDVNLTVWYQANGTCTTATSVGSGAVTGTWASFAGLSTTLAKGATSVFCIRSTIPDRQDAAATAGTLSFVPRVSASLSVGNFAATATATATALDTQYIYPFATISNSNWYMVKSSGQCMDVSGGGTSANGTAVISYQCKTSDTTNQEWQFTRDGSTEYYDITPRSGVSTSVRADTNGQTSAGSAITVRTDSSSAGQLWQPQLVSTGTYQFVNKSTGLCLTSTTTSAGAVTQAICNGGTAQRWTLTSTGSAGATQLQNLGCSAGNYSQSAGITWTLASEGGYTAQAYRTSTSQWYTVSATSSTWADNVQVTATTLPSGTPMTNWGNGTYAVRILNGAGSVVGTSSLEIYTASWGTRYVRCD